MTIEQIALIPFPGPAFPTTVINHGRLTSAFGREQLEDDPFFPNVDWSNYGPSHFSPALSRAFSGAGEPPRAGKLRSIVQQVDRPEDRPFVAPEDHPDGYSGHVRVESAAELEDGDLYLMNWRGTVERGYYRWERDVESWVFVNYADPRPSNRKAWEDGLAVLGGIITSVLGNEVMQLILAGVAFVPGIGTAVVATAAALAAVGRGESIGDVALSAARGAVPGGALGALAFDVGVGLVRGDGLSLTPEQALALTPAIKDEFGAEAAAAYRIGVDKASSTSN